MFITYHRVGRISLLPALAALAAAVIVAGVAAITLVKPVDSDQLARLLSEGAEGSQVETRPSC